MPLVKYNFGCLSVEYLRISNMWTQMENYDVGVESVYTGR